jgi:hypothetical protein
MGTAYLKVLTAFTLVIATSAPVAAEQFSAETPLLVTASVEASATLRMSFPSEGHLLLNRVDRGSGWELLLAQSQPTPRDTCNAGCDSQQEQCLATPITNLFTGEVSPAEGTICNWIRRECRINCLAQFD